MLCKVVFYFVNFTRLRPVIVCSWLVAVLNSVFTANADTPSATPPSPTFEFRAAWVATVANIDWPSDPHLPVSEQQHELLSILNTAKELNLNAIILQVRPACDALYQSRIEPWSEFLTGEMGKAPEPLYDPLKFAVDESHKLGLELHAWVNPFRARPSSSTNELATNHISQTSPEMVIRYGKFLWLDPAQKAVQDYTAAVVRDIVQRYDIDGVHLDDYFYPYREKNENGEEIDFPDDDSWTEYVASGGLLSRDDWRRDNVNKLVERLYRETKAAKAWVKFGVAPFGIWQPGFPPEVKGFNAYEKIYCDSLKWLTNGWLDYIAPQIYWKLDAPEQSYTALLKWWTEQNTKARHIWVGNFTSRIALETTAPELEKKGKSEPWPVTEIINQIKATRLQAGAGGNIHFSMRPLMDNRGKLADQLRNTVYAEPALVPPCAWLQKAPPAKPTVQAKRIRGNNVDAQWSASETPWQWAVQVRTGGQWHLQVFPGHKTSGTFVPDSEGHAPEFVAVSAVSRCGVTSESVVYKVH